MGFGIATIGYLFLLAYEAGGGVFASVILAYGFYLASGVNKRFLAASVSSLFLFPHSLLLLLDVIGVVTIDSVPLLRVITYSLFYLAWLSLSFNYLTAIKQIAAENKNKMLENKASNRLYITCIFLIAAFSVLLFRDIVFPAIAGFLYVMQYAVILINAMFLHTCFLMITTPSQYRKDKELVANENKKLLEKRRKDKEEK